MHRERRLSVILSMFGFAVTLGIMFLLMTSDTQLIQMSKSTPTTLEMRLETMRIRKTDFPSPNEWQEHEPRSEEAFTALVNMIYVCDHKDAFWIKVSQRLHIYPYTNAAQAAYDYALDEWFTPEWSAPPRLDFSGHADKMSVRCIEGYINNIHHYPCRAIGIYGDTVVVLLANVFDDRWLTMDDFAQLLTVMDQRIADATQQTEP